MNASRLSDIGTAVQPPTAAQRLFTQALGAGLITAGLVLGNGHAEAGPPATKPEAPVLLPQKELGDVTVSTEARGVIDWITETRDNGPLPFVIVDKRQARVYVFDAHGQLRGASAALLGLTLGDRAAPRVGERPLSRIGPADRTTQAGRFDATLGNDLQGEQVLWVDYDSGLALHRLVSGRPSDHRAQRLAMALPRDHRITYGCINVPGTLFRRRRRALVRARRWGGLRAARNAPGPRLLHGPQRQRPSRPVATEPDQGNRSMRMSAVALKTRRAWPIAS